MENITRKKKEKIIDVIADVEMYLKNTSTPEKYTKSLDKIRQFILREKYGLNFEEYSEKYNNIEKMKLTEIDDSHINAGGKENILIEGENLVVLKLLKEKYRERIDVICIDPPYNTGMDWLNYTDDTYVEEDSYVSSKWLSFMNNRLKIAYELLSEDGVFFIHIDEHETATLLLLCQQLFGDNNVYVLIWPKTDSRFDMNRVEKPYRDIKIIHEYVFVCFKNREKTNLNKIVIPTLKNGELVDSKSTMETIINGLGTTSSAKDELANIFGDRYVFQTPKPMRLIKEFIRAASKTDSTVMDFFAGSGTTGHSVMDLNKEDDGNRKFILVNNNENNICRGITYERLKRIIDMENYVENLKYYRVEQND